MMILIDDKNRITSYAVMGSLVGGIEVDLPKDMNLDEINLLDYDFNPDTKEFTIGVREPLPPTEEEQKREQTTLAIKSLISSLPDENILQIPLLFDEWSGDGIQYVAERDVVRFEGGLYRVTITHTSQSDWSPNRALTLFNRISNQDDIEEWQAGNSYAKGTKVKLDGVIYESQVDNNVWKPTEVGDHIWRRL